jgi:hypothetical protein
MGAERAHEGMAGRLSMNPAKNAPRGNIATFLLNLASTAKRAMVMLARLSTARNVLLAGTNKQKSLPRDNRTKLAIVAPRVFLL